MSERLTSPLLPPVSAEVNAEALARAERLSAGLFPHQVDGVAFLLGRRRAILADDMGLGKTRQSIVAMAEAAPAGPWLVVSPASVKRNWEREIGMARPSDRTHVFGAGGMPTDELRGWLIINYDLLARHRTALQAIHWAGVIFDEAHYLKNHRSQRSRIAREIVMAAPETVVHCLTGTPLTNRPRDVFPLMQMVGHPMSRSFLSFAKRYCAATHNGFGWVTDGASNIEELRIQLHGVMLRRTKDAVLDLPPKLRSWLPVSVAEGTARHEMRQVLELLIAGQLERAAAERAAGGEARKRRGHRGQDRTRLLALITKARLQLAKAKVATTIAYTEDAVEQGEKVIVFTAFDEPARKIAEHFGKAAVMLTGRTTAKGRELAVQRFQEDDGVRVFVANIIAGGVGITLTAAQQVVFNDLDWVPTNHWQAEDRAYRIGQTKTVNVTYMVADGTIDEFVRQTLQAKASLIDAIVEGRASAVLDGDLLADLERLVTAMSPMLASLSDTESQEDPVDRLLREVVAASVATGSGDTTTGGMVGEAVRRLPADAIMALARSLAGPVAERYVVSSARNPDRIYLIDVDGSDVTCTCSGFAYRGTCRHALQLKTALMENGPLPDGMTHEWPAGRSGDPNAGAET